MMPRKLKIFRPCIKYCVVGFLYLIWVKITEISLPCPICAVTGYYCPSCGITTMFLCLTSGDFYGAFLANPAIFSLLPVIAWLIVKNLIYKGKRQKPSKFFNIILSLTIITLIAYGFMRN